MIIFKDPTNNNNINININNNNNINNINNININNNNKPDSSICILLYDHFYWAFCPIEMVI